MTERRIPIVLQLKQDQANHIAQTTDYVLVGECMTLGRTAENDICLPDGEVSRKHALLRCRDEGWEICDLGSSNGTFINDLKLVPQVASRLSHGQQIRIGSFVLTVSAPDVAVVVAPSAEITPSTQPDPPQPAETPPQVNQPVNDTPLKEALREFPLPTIKPPESPVKEPQAPQKDVQQWQPMLRWALPALVVGLMMMVGAVAWRGQSPDVVLTSPQIVDSHIVDAAEFLPTPMAIPTLMPDALVVNSAESTNLLSNGSFESAETGQNGWQTPDGWSVISTGENVGDPDVILISSAMLPADDRDRYILDGDHTLNIVTRDAPMRVRLFTTVQLAAGTYQLTVNLYPDIVEKRTENGPQFATDPTAADVRLLGSSASEWQSVAYGLQNNLGHQFTVDAPTTILVGIDLRAPYSYRNNGWFLDQFSLVEINNR